MLRIFFFLFIVSNIYIQQQLRELNYSNTATTIATDAATFTGTRTSLQLNNNPSFRFAQTTDYGYGSWTKVPDPKHAFSGNGITILRDAIGQVWKLNVRDDEVLIDWFLPDAALPDTADKTIYIQQALDTAVNKKLIFNPRYKYLCKTVFPSDGTTIDFNNAVIQPYWKISQAEAVLFHFNAAKINWDGKYTYTSVHGTAKKRKKLKGVTFINGIFQMNNYNIDAVKATAIYSKWTIVDNFIVKNCISYNCSGRSFTVAAPSYINDSSAIVKNAQIVNVKTYYNGQNIGIYVTTPGSVGDTSVYISTADKMSISDRIGVGQYIKLGSADINPNIQLRGNGTTNKIYQVKRFIPDADDSTKGRIDITGGSYDKVNGFIDSSMGLTAKVWANTIFLPIEGWAHPVLLGTPNFNGVTGSTTITRSTINAQQDAFMKNLYPGMDICVYGEPGNFRIVAKTSTSLIVDKPLLSTFNNRYVKTNGIQNDAIAFMGNIEQMSIDSSFLYANKHGLALLATSGKGLYQEDVNTNLSVTNTSFWYSWMSVEQVPGAIVRFSIDKAGLKNKFVNKGDTLFRVAKSHYRVDYKDVNNDAVNDIALTDISTTNAGITFKNAIFVGEIFGSPRFHFKYKLTSITDGADSITLGFQRWDNYQKKTVPGGFDVSTLINGIHSSFGRLFSIYSGESDVVKNQTYIGNTFNYLWRENGAGYNLSIRGYNVHVNKNEFNNAGSSPFEIVGYQLSLKNNKVTNYLFDGSKIMPAVWTERKYLSAGANAGGWGTIASNKVDIMGNEVRFIQAPAISKNDYSLYTGSMTVFASNNSLYGMEKFNFSNNIINGVRNNLIGTVESENIRDRTANYYAPVFYFDEVMISGNTITLPKDYINAGIFSPLLSAKTSIVNNTIIAAGQMKGNFAEFSNTGLNPKLFDTTATYKTLIISGNKYPSGTIPALNLRIDKERIVYDGDEVSK